MNGEVHTISVLYRAHIFMKCSLGISDFLQEISSLSHSVVFLYFFTLITEESFLISPCYSLELCIQMGTSFLFSFAFHFSSFHSYANIRWIMEKAREFQRNVYFYFIDYAKAFDCVDHSKLWKILKEMGGISDHLICLLRNLYAGQEATVRTGHGTTDWFQIGKGVRQGCLLSPCLFNLYAEYIMRNAGLEEAQPGIKIARRNINNLRYADDTTLMAESEEELKSLLMKVKEDSEKAGLKLNIQKTKTMVSSPIPSWQIDGETVETVSDYFFGLQNHCR